MADKTPDRTFHDPDPSLDDPVAAAWFESLNALAFDVFEGAVNKEEARKFLNLSNVPDATDTGTDDYDVALGGPLAAGDVFTAYVGSVNTTSSPTLNNTSGTDGPLAIVTTALAAFPGMLQARPHRFLRVGPSNYIVLDPAGGVVEKGSNASGQFVRFADGTLICTANLTLTFDSIVYLNATWTYPAAFSAIPDNIGVLVDGNDINANATPGLSQLGQVFNLFETATSTEIRLYRQNGQADFVSGDTGLVRVFAKGEAA